MLQAMVYMFTDVQIPDRYTYAGHCYRNFHERARALFRWMQDVSTQSCCINRTASFCADFRASFTKSHTNYKTQFSRYFFNQIYFIQMAIANDRDNRWGICRMSTMKFPDFIVSSGSKE
jgi:hypothetical protein